MSEQEQPQIVGAICAPPSPSQEAAPVQPRQPTSMQGLLRFAMEATKAEDAPHESHMQPLDEQRRRFLEQALHSLTVDVMEILMKQIKILENVDQITASDDETDYITALDTISEYVCDIDTANDFHKIGGFVILAPCLKCKIARIRAEGCNLLAELCQNNPYCQKVVLENGILPILIEIVEKDEEIQVIVKALYAISCIVRQNSSGCAQLIQYRGVQILHEALKKKNEKISTKICFLLLNLSSVIPDFRSRLVFMGYIRVLFSLISTEPKTSDEHVLELLLKLLQDNPTAQNEARNNELNTRSLLESYLSEIKGKDEYSNEEETCTRIYNILFAQNH